MQLPRTRARLLAAAVGLLAAAALSGCSGATAELPDGSLPAAFDDGVPEPTGEVVLTVVTDDAEHDWDVATLAELPEQDLRITEPFVDEEHTYTGPLLGDVLRASGVDLAAGDTVEVLALDDFVADLALDGETLDGLVLAHAEDGDPIPIEAGGPIRLVFPPDNPAGENPNNWVWSVRTATVS